MKPTRQRDGTYMFKLSEHSAEYLRGLLKNDLTLAKLLGTETQGADFPRIIRLDASCAERVRAKLTEQLAATGFRKDYALTDDGKNLEGLIDVFYIGGTD